MGNLVCFERSGSQTVPGCTGRGESGRDYCISPGNLPPTPPPQSSPSDSFRLKLYWEQGYFWQEETRERKCLAFIIVRLPEHAVPVHLNFWTLLCSIGKWCATFDYDGYPGPGYCWYGDDSDDCNSNQVYLAKCGNERNQRFRFVDLSNGEVLIQLANNDNECWERSNRRIYVERCDSNNSRQRWYAPNSSFGGSRFEISQRGFSSQCISNDHHPKAAEVIEMHSCDGSRNSDTSYWNRY